MTKNIFCAQDQEVTAHTLTVGKQNEIIATCGCGRALKFPAGMSRAQFDDLVAKHETANRGHVLAEDLAAEHTSILENLAD